jgi:uncharacterized protein (TIGR02145 family)
MKNIYRISRVILLISSIFTIYSCKKDEPSSSKVDTIIDIEGNSYPTVRISNQWWMAENLRTTKYSNGDLIGTTTPATLDISAEAAPKYQWAYDGNENNAYTYGRLYTRYAVADSRNVCPTGWHVPSDAEWTTLTTFLGGDSDAGNKLKETGTIHWEATYGGETNSSGFTALPGGFRYPIGAFVLIRSYGYWWCSSHLTDTTTYYRFVSSGGVFRDYHNEPYGFSVRCLRD